MEFISIDPALANTALVFGETEGDELRLIEYKLIQTKKEKGGTDEVVGRCELINNNVHDYIKEKDPDYVLIETPSGSQSFMGGVSYAVVCYLIATIKRYKEVLTTTPVGMKKHILGKNDATKEEIIEYVGTKYPYFELPMVGTQINKSKAEHIADAVGVAETCLNIK